VIVSVSVRCLALAAMAFLAGCATVENPAPALPARAASPALYTPPQEGEYRLQVGDTIAIRSYYDSQLNQEMLVRPDGKITALLIGEIAAAGLTPDELATQVRLPYRRLVGETDVTVAVVRSAGMNVYVSGEIRTPSMVPLDGGMTLLQAIARTGGTLPSAKTHNVLLIRNDGAGALSVYQVDIDKVLRNEASDVYLHRRDVVFVPKSEIAEAGQFVEQYVNAIVPRFLQVQLGWTWSSAHVTNRNPVVEFAPQ
jgi:polysaccharide export outer membrane protein